MNKYLLICICFILIMMIPIRTAAEAEQTNGLSDEVEGDGSNIIRYQGANHFFGENHDRFIPLFEEISGSEAVIEFTEIFKIRNDSEISDYIDLFLLVKKDSDPLIPYEIAEREARRGKTCQIEYILDAELKAVLDQISIQVRSGTEEKVITHDDVYRYNLMRIDPGTTAEFKVSVKGLEYLKEEERALLDQMNYYLTAFDLNEHPGIAIDAEIINHPENGKYYIHYLDRETEFAPESEYAYVKFRKENIGNVPVENATITVMVLYENGKERVINQKIEGPYFEPGEISVSGEDRWGNTETSAALCVWFDKQNAEEGYAKIRIVYEAYLENPDFQDPIRLEKIIELPVGFGKCKTEAVESEPGTKAGPSSMTEIDSKTEGTGLFESHYLIMCIFLLLAVMIVSCVYFIVRKR